MKKYILTFIILVLFCTGTTLAQEPESFDAAKSLSKIKNIPLLLEFERSDCEYCAQAAHELEQNTAIKSILANVIHLPINVLVGEGIELKKRYSIGTTYPVFVVTNSEGDVISRWTGFNSPSNFIQHLQNALKDQTTVKQKVSAFDKNPTLSGALELAQYFTETQEYLDALKYYRRAENLGGDRTLDYSFQIFKSIGNAAWTDMAPLDSVYPLADRYLKSGLKNQQNLVKLATIMSRLTRKYEDVSHLEKYLQAGIDACSGKQDESSLESYHLLVAELALQIDNDTIAAIGIREKGMGDNWERQPPKFYPYAQWCLERKVNLAEAETFARRAIEVARTPEFKARVMNTVAEICYARGNAQEAVHMIVLAIEQHPDNPFYDKQLEKFRKDLEEK